MSAIKRRQALRHDSLTLIKLLKNTFYPHPTSVTFSASTSISTHWSILVEPCSGKLRRSNSGWPRRPWLTRVRSEDGSALWSGEDFCNKGKSLHPERVLRALSTRQLSVTLQCSIITTPTGWKRGNESKWNVFLGGDIKMILQFQNKRIPTKWTEKLCDTVDVILLHRQWGQQLEQIHH